MDSLPGFVLDTFMKCRIGDNHFKAGKYPEAKNAYWKAAKEVVGAQFRIPGVSGADDGARNDKYINLHPLERANLQGCCAGLAKCLVKEGDLESALAWLEECNILYKTSYLTTPVPLYDWIDYSLNVPELTFRRTVALCTSSDVFLSLDNTGTAAERRWISSTGTVSLPSPHQTPRLQQVLDKDQLVNLIQLRHPDPARSAKFEVKDLNIQVRGSWRKLPVRASETVKPRYGCQSFIWKSHLYMGGGQSGGLGPFHHDFWYLDLEKLSDGWKPLSPYPAAHRNGLCLGWQFLVHETPEHARAYLFTGSPKIDYFDLRAQKWGSIATTYEATSADRQAGVQGNWPWRGKQWRDGASCITRDRLLVFGGMHRDTNIGCNLFMALDMKTLKWRRLTGFVMPPKDHDYSMPGPRKNPACWVSKDTDRFYVLFGVCDRSGAHLRSEPHGSTDSYGFGDFWSWSIKDEKWRVERLAGNPPCPRTEMAFAYNKKLDKVVVFGGYAPCLPTLVVAAGKQFNFSYFADTFIYQPPDPSNLPSADPLPSPSLVSRDDPKFKQVLTRGFPTYRCQATMTCDPDTGKTYLFGGFTNSDYVPSKGEFMTRAFGDVWQLRMDMPGGFFDKVDWEEEGRTAKAGPWQRCFGCGDAGQWKKCGGSCRGRAFFCNADCQKEGWKEHKRMHNCRKL